MRYTLVVLTAVMLCGCSGVNRAIRRAFAPVDMNHNMYIHDTEGRIVIYHGVNVSNFAKHSGPPSGYFDRGKADVSWHTKEDFARMNEWGFNLVRYMVFWEAIEPERGQFDEDYLARTVERLQWLRELGIDAIVDIHQDLYAQKFAGNGFPGWAIRDSGHEFERQHPWDKNYLQPAVFHSYNNFWRNDTLKTRYLAMLHKVFSCVDTLPNVAGIDVMNEPFPDLSMQFERETLSSLYHDIRKMVETAGFRTRMYFEPVIYTSAGIPSSLTFEPDTHCVYYPHYYDPLCDKGKPYRKRNHRRMELAVAIKVNEAQKFGVPVLYGEFGVDPKVGNYLTYIEDLLNECDRYGVGWTYYSYDKIAHCGFGIIDNERNEMPNMDKLVRVYPQRIAGRNPRFGIKQKRFTLTYENSGITAPTLVFIPDRLNGVAVSANGKPVEHSGRIFEYRNDSAPKQEIVVTWQ